METVSEGKEAVASAVPVRQTVPETEPDFVIVCVNVCVQVKYSVAVEEREAPVEGVTEPLVVRDTCVLDPVLDVVPVLLTLALADTVAVGTTVRVLTAVAETVAVPMLDLLCFMVAETDTEVVDVFVLEGEPLALRVCIGL